MKAIDFKEANNYLGKPENMTDKQCYTLPVRHHIDGNGFPGLFSCWELTDEDIERIINTRKIWVNTIGDTLAPFSLQTEFPFQRKKVLINNPDGLIGDFLGTLPAIIDLARIHDVTMVIHSEALPLFDLIPKKYNIQLASSIDKKGFDYFDELNISAAFNMSHQRNMFMSQTYYSQIGLYTPIKPPKADLEIPWTDVPSYDYIIAPFSRSLPPEQRWPQEKWQELVDRMPDRTFCVIGHGRDPINYVRGSNVREMYNQPIAKLCYLLKSCKHALISVVSGPSHLAFHLGVKNILLTNQGMTWGNNPDALPIKIPITTLTSGYIADCLPIWENDFPKRDGMPYKA